MLALVVVVVASLAAGEPLPPEPAPVAAAEPGHWGFAAVPRLTYSVDDGLGLGVRGTAFWYRFHTSPYKTAISFQAWATSSLVQHHYLRVDAIDAFNVPVRIGAEAGLYSTQSQNDCGLGDLSICRDGDLSKVRYIAPLGEVIARVRAIDAPKLELIGGWRGAVIVPGTFTARGPYPDSTFARAHPDGEPGVVSAPLVGVAVDTRDFEPWPTRGIFAAGILSVADPNIGSSWRFARGDVELAVFSPVVGRTLVLASRIVGDVIVGDAPVVELQKTGGLRESFAFGGEDIGRGLRTSRFVGAVKLMAQHELRADFGHLDVFDNDLGVGAAVFMDIGAVATDLDSLAARVPIPAWGAGIGLRASWNRAFVMRIDLAMSPTEGPRIGAYTAPGQPF